MELRGLLITDKSWEEDGVWRLLGAVWVIVDRYYQYIVYKSMKLLKHKILYK